MHYSCKTKHMEIPYSISPHTPFDNDFRLNAKFHGVFIYFPVPLGTIVSYVVIVL